MEKQEESERLINSCVNYADAEDGNYDASEFESYKLDIIKHAFKAGQGFGIEEGIHDGWSECLNKALDVVREQIVSSTNTIRKLSHSEAGDKLTGRLIGSIVVAVSIIEEIEKKLDELRNG
jgi:hypothetical protein